MRSARRLAEILQDDGELYAAWAAAHESRNINTIVQSARRYEALRRNPNLRVEVIGRDEVSLEPSSSHAVFSRAHVAEPLLAEPLLAGDRDFVRIPVIAEGTDPGAGPEPECEVLEYLRLDASRIPREERLVRPFAYRLSQAGVQRVHDLLHAGDCVVITRDGAPPVRNEIYAVRRDRYVQLSRVILRPAGLVLLSSRGQEDIDVVPLAGEEEYGPVILGRVAIAVRPWQFTLFSPSQALPPD